MTGQRQAASLLRQDLAQILLRASLAVIFIWFGALKLFGVSPVEDLVANTIPGMDTSRLFVPLLGSFEVVLGLALLVDRHPLVLTAAIAHLIGTFTVLVTQSHLAFQDANPLLLTTEGEFVIKNLVLLAAAVAVSSIRPRTPDRVRIEGGR